MYAGNVEEDPPGLATPDPGKVDRQILSCDVVWTKCELVQFGAGGGRGIAASRNLARAVFQSFE